MYQELDLLSDTKPLVKHPWMLTKRFILVTEANIAECIDACINGLKGRFSLDIETTGLDNRVFDGHDDVEARGERCWTKVA